MPETATSAASMSAPCAGAWGLRFCAGVLGGLMLAGLVGTSPAQAQNPGPQGIEPRVHIDITPLPRDPCEDAYRQRSSVTIHGAPPPEVRTAPSARIPADGTLGCLPPYQTHQQPHHQPLPVLPPMPGMPEELPPK